MKRFFLTVSCLMMLGLSAQVYAEVIPLAGLPDLQARQKKVASEPKNPLAPAPGMPDKNDEDAVRSFFKKRFEEAAKMPMSADIDWENPSSTSVVPPPEVLERQKEAQKSTFEKMYEETLAAFTKKNDKETAPDGSQTLNQEKEEAASATRFFIRAPQEQKPQEKEPQIATVGVTLPNGRKILAPAAEHIPYFLSYIDIQSNGYIKVEDTITIVANGKKFAYGLTRVFPKYTSYQGQREHRIELMLDSVTVNDTKVPYIAEEAGGNILLKPKYNQELAPGVYTYKFKYMINNKLQKSDNLVFLNWNMTGKAMNVFITSANAIVSLPEGNSFRDVAAFVGQGMEVTNQRTNVFNLAKNVMAFSNITPILSGESMNVVTVVGRNVFLKGFDESWNIFLIDWGNVFYASIGFLAILLSFILSFINLKNERKNRYAPSYGGALMRTIFISKFDRVSYVAKLLELYRKNAIDLVNENNRLFVVAKNIKGSRLTKNEKKALACLFGRKNKQVEVNVANNQKFKKAGKQFDKEIKKQIKKFRLLQNISYILFSVLMLLLTEFFIASIAINFAQSVIILLSCSLLFAFYVGILQHRFKNRFIGLLLKLFSLAAIAAVWTFCSVYIGGITAALILAMIVTIFRFSIVFSEQNNFINDAKTVIGSYKEYLISSADVINLSRDFANQQSNIFALGIGEYYTRNVSNQNVYKLDVADDIKQSLIGII